MSPQQHPLDLTCTVALVTGATSGIGRAAVAPARIVMVASIVRGRGAIDIDDQQSERDQACRRAPWIAHLPCARCASPQARERVARQHPSAA